MSNSDTETLERVNAGVNTDGCLTLMLYNDDHNSFDFVIEALIDVLHFDAIQAEQITMIVHFKGKCGVKRGAVNELKPLCTRLIGLGLTARLV